MGDRQRNLVKVSACVVVSGALGLELWNILTQGDRYSEWSMVFALARFVLISHGIEAIIAGFFAPAKGKSPLNYGVYTFFVGTISLIELFQQSPRNRETPPG
ncbi:MAG: hypothetical protein RLZZ568_1490 [Cyanobacteriota bacterium]|jgi:uncharacterized membrane protein